MILQLNIEGISKGKSDHLITVLATYKIVVLLLQITHISDESQLHNHDSICGYKVTSAIHDRRYDSVTYIKNNITNYSIK